MTGAAASVILGFLLATAIGCAFHILVGGPPGRIVMYVSLSLLGFMIGHFTGQGLRFNLMKLGALHLFTATVGSLLTLFIGRWIWPLEFEEE